MHQYKVGDHVRVISKKPHFEGRGPQWNSWGEMDATLGKVGEVISVAGGSQSVMVQFPKAPGDRMTNEWLYHPDSLEPVERKAQPRPRTKEEALEGIEAGCTVRIVDASELTEEYTAGWQPERKKAAKKHLGAMFLVARIDDDGDVSLNKSLAPHITIVDPRWLERVEPAPEPEYEPKAGDIVKDRAGNAYVVRRDGLDSDGCLGANSFNGIINHHFFKPADIEPTGHNVGDF